jgi:predicted CXXCH cytochrome family protein
MRVTHIKAILLSLALIVGAQVAVAQQDRLSLLDTRATTGAAPGYVSDATCGRCHAELYRSYQDVGMAKSFRRAGNATDIEDFGDEYYHEPSQRYYRITSEGGKLVFHRYQRDHDGNPINELELPVSWVMGSGNRARSYLHQNDWGEMFLLPLSWYSESESWGMSPGFGSAAHEGIHRSIQRECMFCHNAYPEVEPGSDFPYSPELFPENLPEGTGCQRCHGPGADHVNSVLNGNDIERIRATIVNPAKLPAERRDEVCFQCHMLPSYLVTGVRRFERSVYSFRPGQKLSDYLVNIDADEEGVPESEQFEINHHGYRLYQSNCYRESQGELGCISCHDPHQKKQSRELRSSVVEVCTECHASPADLHQPSTAFTSDDCVSCHMPTRRTRDVVNVTMTDHRIARGPFDFESLVSPREEGNAPLTNIEVLPLEDSPIGSEAEVYQLMAVLRANRSVGAATNSLGALLEQGSFNAAPPLVEFATGSLSTGQFGEAERAALRLIETGEYLPAAHKLLGVSLMAQNLRVDAVEALKESLRLQPDPEVHFNLAAAYIRYGENRLAEQQLRAAIQLRPTMSAAWKYLGLIHGANGRLEEARRALVRSIELEPNDLQAYGDLINLLREEGNIQEANRYIELGQRISKSLSQ